MGSLDAPATLLLEPPPTIHYHCDRITEWGPITMKISPQDSAMTTHMFPWRGPVLPSSTTTQRLIPCALWAIWLLVIMVTAGQPVQAASDDETRFKQIRPQFIAALGDPGANSGSGAQQWGLWRLDPGPRGVWLKHYERLQAAGGVAPARWKFDETDWWVEENGLIMEKPQFPLPSGQYVVTGGREVTTVLTVHPMDQDGDQRWELRGDATIHDVTHLRCRSARYTPATPRQPVLASQGANDRISGGSRRLDAADRGLQQAGLFGSLHHRCGRGRLTAGDSQGSWGGGHDASRLEECPNTSCAVNCWSMSHPPVLGVS